eukprot:4455769-Alexandrium_andersonii.AAC.1
MAVVRCLLLIIMIVIGTVSQRPTLSQSRLMACAMFPARSVLSPPPASEAVMVLWPRLSPSGS